MESLQKVLKYTFKNKELLQRALTHSSWSNENKSAQEHNERQEFLGDAVLEVCVSWALYTRFPTAREGDLTCLRSSLVSAPSLASLAREFGIDRSLQLGRGEESQGGRARDNVLADALEAVLGAVFEDGGYGAAYELVTHLFAARWPKDLGNMKKKDFKTQLQEATQSLQKHRPVYNLFKSHGPEHAKVFEVHLTLPDGRIFCASGASVKGAEQEAARMALENFLLMPEEGG